MAYHLFKKLQKVSNKESRINKENPNDGIDKWVKDLNDIVDKTIVDDSDDDGNNFPDKYYVVNIKEYLKTVNKIVTHSEKIKNKKGDEFKNEKINISYIKEFCKILNTCSSLLNKLKTEKKKESEILKKNNIWDMFEEIILNSSEVLNKIICLNKGMFHKKNIRIDCNEFKIYINYLNILFKETHNCDILFDVFYLEFENSISIKYEIILLLQKLYIYDNINFYFYLYENIVYSDNINSCYYYNLFCVKFFQILYSDYYTEGTNSNSSIHINKINNNINLNDQNKIVTNLHEQCMLIINKLRKGKYYYTDYINYPFNYSSDKIIYKNKNDNYYINENKEFHSIPLNKTFKSYIFDHANDFIIQKKLKTIDKKSNLYELATDSHDLSRFGSSCSYSDDINTNFKSVENEGKNKTKIGNKNDADISIISENIRRPYQNEKQEKSNSIKDCSNISSFNINSQFGSKKNNFNEAEKNNIENINTNNGNARSSNDDPNEDSLYYFSSDISNDIISVNEEFDEEKKKKKKIYFCEENIFLIIFRNNKIRTLRNSIDNLVLNRNNFVCELITLMGSNQNAYLINEIILLLLLISKNNSEIKNIITYERVIECILKTIKEEHIYLFNNFDELFFLHSDNHFVQINAKIKVYCFIDEVYENSEIEKENIKRSNSNDYISKSLQKIDENVTTDGKLYDYNFIEIKKNSTDVDEKYNSIELYLDNISVNIDIKSSLLLLHCLIINSDFVLKYIYELNILDEFIKLVLNLYNINIYVYKNIFHKFYTNSLFITSTFIDIIYNIVKVSKENRSVDISLEKLLPIFQRGNFFEGSIFFLFKFVLIHLTNISKYTSKNNKRLIEPHESVKSDSNFYSPKREFATSDTGSHTVMASNKKCEVVEGSNLGDSWSGHEKGPPNYNSGANNINNEMLEMFKTFIHTNVRNILSICCKFLYEDEKYCSEFIFSHLNATKGSNNSGAYAKINKSKSVEALESGAHEEETSFILKNYRQNKYFYYEHMLIYYINNLNQIKYVDMLLIIFFFDKKNVIQNYIYEFFMCLCEKHSNISKYLNYVFFVQKNLFYYYVSYIMIKIKKKSLQFKKFITNLNKLVDKGENIDPTKKKHIENEVERKKIFFYKYMKDLELAHKICNLTVNGINIKDEENGNKNDNDNNNSNNNVLNYLNLNFEEIVYYNCMYVHMYNGKEKKYFKKLNNSFNKNILIYRIYNFLCQNSIGISEKRVKLMISLLINKFVAKRVSCLICVYISIYLLKEQNDKAKNKVINIIIEKKMFNSLYNFLNDFIKYKFDNKYFFCAFTQKSKIVEQDIQSVLHIKKNKYFLFYSYQKDLYFIHYIYSNFIHHNILTYFFNESKKEAGERNCLDEFEKRRSQRRRIRNDSPKASKYKACLSDASKKKYKYYEMNNGFSNGETGSESSYEIEENCTDKKNYENSDFNKRSNETEDYESDESIQRNQINRKTKYLPNSIANRGNKNKKGKNRKKAKSPSLIYMCNAERDSPDRSSDSSNYYLNDEKNKSKGKNKRAKLKKMMNDINNMRKKLHEDEIKYIEEKLYLNKMIEKKNDIINNILYSYLLIKEKSERIEEENTMLKNKNSLREKEHEILMNNNMDELKKEHIKILDNYEKINNENKILQNKVEQFSDLLIYLYNNVKGCSKYMENIENLSFFNNKKKTHNINDQTDKKSGTYDQLNAASQGKCYEEIYSNSYMENYIHPSQESKSYEQSVPNIQAGSYEQPVHNIHVRSYEKPNSQYPMNNYEQFNMNLHMKSYLQNDMNQNMGDHFYIKRNEDIDKELYIEANTNSDENENK
ncbi:conserved Plasmodium protein, unknown function [Plasmodium berghei]|uniref:Uncharacterized protein n=2 Tax=Plasmodium berghei TaxID=5821 RepID=A0A509AKK7_PLABA|nr:conserved Plasmodium protein, unknown function [Plasmodium berghei ANKA]SCM20729.1 conserved Plasmodium protein, unknown function [Plasmodium berghei]SCN24286.1 conserved Plasmodium protein, unknown function [Plasmodium berghei]SCO60712.1 conserved Plasmodium protein, unknown function [Plasmodium berghei]VUC55201.1 conserved Plasmodium protein, unknown function [Plasmodium berghei ANKA]|eukprot:XP_034421014.1 conserved Plasmodium protein, unknown function [Plasmodium berghei ANKA]